jgi:hypothetical protein
MAGMSDLSHPATLAAEAAAEASRARVLAAGWRHRADDSHPIMAGFFREFADAEDRNAAGWDRIAADPEAALAELHAD